VAVRRRVDAARSAGGADDAVVDDTSPPRHVPRAEQSRWVLGARAVRDGVEARALMQGDFVIEPDRLRPTATPTPPQQPMPLRPKWSPVCWTVTVPSSAWATRITPSIPISLAFTRAANASTSAVAASIAEYPATETSVGVSHMRASRSFPIRRMGSGVCRGIAWTRESILAHVPIHTHHLTGMMRCGPGAGGCLTTGSGRARAPVRRPRGAASPGMGASVRAAGSPRDRGRRTEATSPGAPGAGRGGPVCLLSGAVRRDARYGGRLSVLPSWCAPCVR